MLLLKSRWLAGFALLSALIAARAGSSQSNPQPPSNEPSQAQPSVELNPSYLLGPSDVVTAWVAGGEEFSGKQFMVSPSGFFDFPMAGRVLAAGKTVED